MGLLNAWFEVHKECFNEKLTSTGFIKLLVPEEYLYFLSMKQGSIRYARPIIEQDFLGAGNGASVKSGEQLQQNFQNVEDCQLCFKRMINKYEKRFLSQGRNFIEKFWSQLEEALKSFKETNVKQDGITCEHLINRIHNRIVTEDTQSNLLYAYLYFALFKILPEEFAYTEYIRYEDDFNEYRKKIIDSLGVYSLTGMAMLYALAERKKNQQNASREPNIIALFTKGQLEYYGRGPSGERDIPTAYECYKKVRDLNPYHPMARWAIADLKLSYESGQIKCVIEDFENEKIYNDKLDLSDELQEESKPQYIYSEKWYNEIREDLIIATCYGSAPAENLLGRIIQGKDKEGRIIFPRKYLANLEHDNAEEHYQKSAEKGYVFAYVNLYECQKLKAENMRGSDRIRMCKTAFNNLEEAANLGLPYAANKISQYYLGNVNDSIADVVSVNEYKAYRYAERALRYTKMIRNGYWPFYNIVEFFYFNEKSSYYEKIGREKMKDYLKLAEANCKEDSKDREEFLHKVDELKRKIDKK